MVLVLSKNKKRLMPTSERRCRKLLKAKKARIIRYNPFVIQLTTESKEFMQPVTLGIDMGSDKIGYSVIVEGEKFNKVAKKGEVEHRKYVNAESKTPVLQARSNFRRTRRSRKWYRKPRFLNRKRSEAKCKVCGGNTPTGHSLCRPCAKEGHHNFKNIAKNSIWLPPTVRAKGDVHIRIIQVLSKYLPITHVELETVSFDIHKIVNAEVYGEEYQKGRQYSFENVKMFVRFRDKYQCKMCGKKDLKIEVHHIVPKSKAGSDSPDNLITLCVNCHDEVTGQEEKFAEELRKKIKGKTRQLAKTAQVNSFKEYIKLNIPLPFKETFGYITKEKREKLDLEKSHVNDATAIAIRDMSKPLKDNATSVTCKTQRRAVRQQYKANVKKGKKHVRYRQPFNQIDGIGRGDLCWHEKKKIRVIIDTLLATTKFNAKNVKTGKRIGSIHPKYLRLISKKQSLQF